VKHSSGPADDRVPEVLDVPLQGYGQDLWLDANVFRQLELDPVMTPSAP
jgi:hypothetical protein